LLPENENRERGGLAPVPLSLSIAFAIIASFYVWTAFSDNLSWPLGRDEPDYYNRLVHGFLKGQLSLDAEVPAELLRVPDPYDPAQRPDGAGLHDASLFRGRYYIYYGVVPAVLVLLPFRLLTGVDLPLGAAVLALALAGYLCSLLLLADIRRRFFPRVGAVAMGGIAIALGFASCVAILIRRSSMYDLPIVSGYAFAMAALWCAYRALFSAEHRAGWSAAASIGWALAIGSRPTYLLAPLALLLALREGRARRDVVAAVVPLVVIGGLLAWYNFARFGSPFEFGLRYILSGVYEAKIEHFRLRYVPWNLRAYFFAPSEWGRYFPFLHGVPLEWPRPTQHFGMDIPFGLLVNVPVLWLAALAPLGLVPRIAGEAGREWRVFLAMVAWTAVSVMGFLAGFYAAMARYLVDFAPTLGLLAAIGMLAVLELAGEPRRWIASAVFGLGTIGSAFAVGMFSVSIYDRVRHSDPAGYRALAALANAPVHWIETRWGRAESGPVRLNVIFPTEAGSRSDELVSTGWPGEEDRVRVSYPDSRHVQIGVEHAGAPVVWSSPLALERGAAHALRISLGSLFPPETDPRWQAWSATERKALRRRMRIEVDGQAVIDRYQRFHDATPGTVTIAGNTGGRERFSGRVLASAHEADFQAWREIARSLPPLPGREIRPDAGGTFRLIVRFPEGKVGTREPLVVSGETGGGDILSVEYLADGRARFVLDHWGRRPYLSPAFACEPGRDHRMSITHPFYAPGAASQCRVGEGMLTVAIDESWSWRCRPLLYPVEPDDIFVGRNPIGGSTADEKFSGTLAPWRNETTP